MKVDAKLRGHTFDNRADLTQYVGRSDSIFHQYPNQFLGAIYENHHHDSNCDRRIDDRDRT